MKAIRFLVRRAIKSGYIYAGTSTQMISFGLLSAFSAAILARDGAICDPLLGIEELKHSTADRISPNH